MYTRQALLRIAIIDTCFVPNDKPNADGKVDTRVLPANLTDAQKAATQEFAKGFLDSEYHELHLNYAQQLIEEFDSEYGTGQYTIDVLLAIRETDNLKYSGRIWEEYHGYEDGLICAIEESSVVLCIMNEPGLNDNLFALTTAINAGKPIYKIWPDGTTEWIRK